MLKLTCLGEIRNNGKITGYNLMEKNGSSIILSSYELKRAISTGQMTVSNLKTTKDGVLVLVDNK